MRRLALVILALLVVGLLAGFYPGRVEKPVKDGAGPLAVRLDPARPAPEYHSPLTYWRMHHMDVLNRGDLAEADCLYCHDPQTSCNNCHAYVGVRPIATPATR